MLYLSKEQRHTVVLNKSTVPKVSPSCRERCGTCSLHEATTEYPHQGDQALANSGRTRTLMLLAQSEAGGTLPLQSWAYQAEALTLK